MSFLVRAAYLVVVTQMGRVAYNWMVLALTWAFGLLHLGLLARTRRLGRRTPPLGKP